MCSEPDEKSATPSTSDRCPPYLRPDQWVYWVLCKNHHARGCMWNEGPEAWVCLICGEPAAPLAVKA